MCKFKVGDRVKIVRAGYGCNVDFKDKIVTIVESSSIRYSGRAGYKVSPAIGNTKSGAHDGFIGEESFEYVGEGCRPNYDVIIAWANGAEVEYYSDCGKCWLDCPSPNFYSDVQYRIKKVNKNDMEIERIEKEMRKLADDLKKLKESS